MVKDWFHEFKLENVKKVIEGDVRHLEDAFTWSATLEGTVFWSRICRGSRELTIEDVERLIEMAKEYKEWNEGKGIEIDW